MGRVRRHVRRRIRGGRGGGGSRDAGWRGGRWRRVGEAIPVAGVDRAQGAVSRGGVFEATRRVITVRYMYKISGNERLFGIVDSFSDIRREGIVGHPSF